MSPPSPCFRSATYSSAGVSTKVEFAHSTSGVAEVKTCFVVPLMNDANGSSVAVGQ